jgi:hypothetical protein
VTFLYCVAVSKVTTGGLACTVLVLTTLSSCSSDDTAARPRASIASSARPATPSGPASTTSPTAPSPSPTRATGGPTPGSLAVPDTSSGPLTRRSFPTPGQLGPGWRYAVDPGNAEEGYAGNGTPAVERNAQEVAQTAVPFGCDRTEAMPAPTNALEVDYTVDGAKVIAVRGRFPDEAAARAFFDGRRDNLRRCLGRSASAAIGPLVARLTRPAKDAVLSDRTPRSDPWRELAVLDGSTVALVAVQGTDHLTDARADRLITLLRR